MKTGEENKISDFGSNIDISSIGEKYIEEIDDEGYVYYIYYDDFTYKLYPGTQLCKKENFTSACPFEATLEESEYLTNKFNY